VTAAGEEPREECAISYDTESAAQVARKTSRWRETLRCWVIAGFEYAARATAMREGSHEWDAIMEEEATVDEWMALTARTLLVSDAATRRPVREIVEIFAKACPHWTFRTITGGGHMAPLAHPDLINPIVREFLDSGKTGSKKDTRPAIASDHMLSAP